MVMVDEPHGSIYGGVVAHRIQGHRALQSAPVEVRPLGLPRREERSIRFTLGTARPLRGSRRALPGGEELFEVAGVDVSTHEALVVQDL